MNSFIGTGQLATNKDVELLFSHMTAAAIPTTVCLVLASGFLADRVRPVYLIAPAFLARGLTTGGFAHVSEVASWASYMLVTLLISSSIFQVIALESLFMKSLPREVRGAMTILMTFFLDIGSLAYNGAAGPIFDNFGATAPFSLVAVFDLVVCVLTVVLGMMGSIDVPQNQAKQAPSENELSINIETGNK